MAAMVFSVLLVSLLSGVQTKVAEANPYDPSTGKGSKALYNIYTVNSPENTTYQTNNVTFNIKIRTNSAFGLSGTYRYFYILDGPANLRVNEARVELLDPVKVTRTAIPETSTTYSYTDTTYEFSVALSGLADGSHNLIWGEAPHYGGDSYTYIGKLTRNLYFYVYCPPTISLSSIKNKNFTSSNVPLTVCIDKPHVGLCYSLDGQSNVTISGNTTLTGLQNGEHTIEVYAGFRVYNDSRAYFEGIGYVGGYQTDWISTRSFFSVNAPTPSAAPSPSPTPTQQPTQEPTLDSTITPNPITDNALSADFTPAILGGIAAIAVAASLLVYFKRRKL
jgi:hypothetical protein